MSGKCLEGAVLGFDVVVVGWFEIVGRGDVFGGMHSDGDGEVDGMGNGTVLT